MKITIKKTILSNALKNVNSIINQNNMNLILTGVYIKTLDNSLQLICSNGSTNFQQIIKDVKIEKPGQILIKARILYDIVNKLNTEEVTLTQIEDSILHIQTPNYSSDVNLLDIFSYPSFKFDHDGWQKITLSSDTIFNISSKIKPFVSQTDNNQYTITRGILFNPIDEKNMEAISSDGIRIAYYKFDYTGAAVKFVADTEFINFADSILTNVKNKSIDLYIQNKKLILFINDTTIVFNLFDNNYPNITKTLFAEQKYFFTIKTNDLLNALNRGVPFVSTDRNPTANLKFENNKLTIKFISPEVGNSFEEIDIINKNVENFEVKLNQKLFAELITTIKSETITFKFNGSHSHLLICSENPYFLNLIVPLRNI